MSRKWIFGLTTLCLMAGCLYAQTFHTAIAKAPEAGTIFMYPERIPLKDGSLYNVERGMMFVPVNRSKANSSVIALEVYRFKRSPKADPKARPIFFLHGGPSFAGLERSLEKLGTFEERWQDMVDVSDVVVVSQRGIGPSKPTTTIEVTRKSFPPDQSYNDEEAVAAYQKMLAGEKRVWEKLGLDLKGFTVIEAAADANDVRKALGYDKIVIWGGSFGSHWGMTLMRYYPEIVERAILRGMEGPDHTYDHPGHIWNVFKRVAKEAENASELKDLIPEGGLIKTIESIVKKVEANPFTVTVTDPEDKEKWDVFIDGNVVRNLAKEYSRNLPAWPAHVIALNNGDFHKAALGLVLRHKNKQRNFKTASYWMLDSGSGITAKRLAKYEADPAQKIIGSTYWSYTAGSPVWGSDLGDKFRQNFETDIPTVIVQGTWDTSTPYENALELVPYFKNCKFIPLKRGPHGAIRAAMKVNQQFKNGIYKFAGTGDMSELPDKMEMPEVKWVVPEKNQAATISHGPILGRLGAHEIGIWARTFRPGTFWVRYGLQPDNMNNLSRAVTTSIEHDNTGWIHIKNLKADTKYFYALTVKGGNATMYNRGGSFRTLPDPEEMRDEKQNPKGLFNFSFEYACGNSQSSNGFGPALPTFRTMLDKIKDKINFAILNGDWLYEIKRDYQPESWLEQVGLKKEQTPDIVKHAPTIVGVWENYKTYLDRGHNLALWHRLVPSFYTIDDHEILDNTYGAGQPGRRNRKAVMRDPAVQAWHDYLAWSNFTNFNQGITFGRAELKAGSDVLTDKEADFTKLDLSQAATLHVHWGGPYAGARRVPRSYTKGGDPNAGVYEIVEVLDAHRIRVFPSAKKNGSPTYSIGRRSYGKMRVSNSDLFLLDLRSHQDMHDWSDPNKPGISIMGKEQKAWLKEQMTESDADFFFVVSSVNFTIPHVGGTGGITANKTASQNPQTGRDDAWTSFVEERKEMIDFWNSLGKPVFVLTGDLHNSFAIRVTDNMWEFASGPHNSRNHSLGAEGGRPVNGMFDSRGRQVDIRWSTFILDDVPGGLRYHPSYCVVQVNNVFNNPIEEGKDRWVAFPRPQVIFQYYDGLTGDLLYAESILANVK